MAFRRFVPTVLVFLVAMALLVACTVSEEQAQQADEDIAGAEIEVRVTAAQLHQDYEGNRVAADLKYDGKVLAVSGRCMKCLAVLTEAPTTLS